MPTFSALDTALVLHGLGYRVHPVNGKSPYTDSWPTLAWTPDLLVAEFAKPHDGVGLQMDGLIDFDCDGGAESVAAFKAWGLPESVAWRSTRGPHAIYAITPEQLERIAQVSTRKEFEHVGVEIRFSSGLQSVIPPTGGREWIRSLLDRAPEPLPDSFVDWIIANIPRRSLPREPRDAERRDRTVDLFNRDGAWADILEPLGWKKTRTRDECGRKVEDWLRPGGTKQLSATTGWCQSLLEDDKLYCFSSSCDPLEKQYSYSKFEAFTLLHHGGDYAAAARDLAAQGYVAAVDPAEVFGHIAGPSEKVASVIADDPEPELTRLLLFPGFVERVAAWHLRRAQTLDLRAGAVAGLMLASWMLGRRVRLFDGTRPNLPIMLTGTPGGGKTEIDSTIASLLDAEGLGQARCQEVTSGPALEDVLCDYPNLIFVRDEIQDLLIDDGGNPHLRSLMERMKRIFSASKGSYIVRKRANEKVQRPPIVEPNLALLLMGVPSVWRRMPEGVYHDGFMARLLAVALPAKVEINRDVDVGAPPAEILAELNKWQGGAVFSGEVEEVPCTDAARDLLLSLKDAWFNKGEEVELYLYRRGQELTCKLALIAGATAGNEVTVDMVERAAQIVEASIRLKLSHWQTRGYGDPSYMDAVARAEAFVRERGCVPFSSHQELRMPYELWRRIAFELVAGGVVQSDGKVSKDGSRFEDVGKRLWVAGHKPGEVE